ncbi:MAG: hypothetical protein WC421_10185 [Elusimicrobiales bacterium]
MPSTETVCIIAGRKRVYYSAVKIAEELLDSRGNVLQKRGEIPDGTIAEHHSARLRVFDRVNGLEDGKAKIFDTETGVCLASEIYSQGVLQGRRELYYPSGALRAEENYKNGRLAGKTKEYYPGGGVRLVDDFAEDRFMSRTEYSPSQSLRQGADGSPAPESAHAAPAPEPQFAPPTPEQAAEQALSAASPQPEGLVRKASDTMRIYLKDNTEIARELLNKTGTVSEIVGAIPDGLVREYYRSGKLKLEENYRDGALNGIRKKYDELGRLWAEETFSGGRLNGIVRIHNYFKDKVFEEEAVFKNDKLDGERKTHYPNGRPSLEEHYSVGKLEGLRKSFYENGVPSAEENYTGDRLNGLRRRYYDTGRIWDEENYADGVLEGERKDYYPTGQMRMLEHYKSGRRDGIRKFFYDTGHPMYEETYINGTLQERKEFKKLGGGSAA